MTKLAVRLTTTTVALIALLACNTNAIAQGCSDAGFCSVGQMGLHATDPHADSSYISLTIGLAGGIGDYKLAVLTPKLELAYRFANGLQFSSRITMQTSSGDLGTVTGPGDIYFTADLPLFESMSITAGLKMPLMSANAQVDGKSVPMDYQPSLGTLDAIIGITINIEHFAVSVAAQVPFVQNQNMFDPRSYSESSAAQQYHATVLYERTPDVLLRVAYEWKLSDDLTIVPSILPILHVANDTYADSLNTRSEIVGSAGLTVNAAVLCNYAVSETSSFGLTLAAPFITRDARPDGLTRKFVAAFEYSVQL